MINEPKASPLNAQPLMVGAVRISADLFPEEARHGAFVRDLDPATVRHLVIELLQAAEEAERQWASLNG